IAVALAMEKAMKQQEIRKQLLHKRNELLGRLQQLGGSVDRGKLELDADPGEQPIELDNLDVLFQLDEASRHELRQVSNALLRMENSEYEFCTLCGSPIGGERLQALPYTDVCRKCAH